MATLVDQIAFGLTALILVVLFAALVLGVLWVLPLVLPLVGR